MSQQYLRLRVHNLSHTPKSIAEEVAGLGLTHMCNAIKPVDIGVGSVREHLGQAAVQVKRVGGGCGPIKNALQAVSQTIVIILIRVRAANHLDQVPRAVPVRGVKYITHLEV